MLLLLPVTILAAVAATSSSVGLATHVHDTGLFEHTNDLMRVIFPLLGAIAGLVVWAFRRLEKADDKVVDTLEKCAAENDKVNDEIFHLIREQEKGIAELHEFMRVVKAHHKHQHNEDL